MKRIRLDDIYSRFIGDASVTDEEATLLMQNLRMSQNAESAILSGMAALSHICYFKPHLFESLFAHPADAFVCMGVGDYEAAHNYVDFLLNDPKGAEYQPLSVEARAWLQETWPTHRDAVDAVLADMMGGALDSLKASVERGAPVPSEVVEKYLG